MRRLVCLTLGASGLALASGCVQMTKDIEVAHRSATRGLTEDRTLTESYTEHLHRLNAIVDLDSKALIDDWDLFWQRDRQTRLTRWHTP